MADIVKCSGDKPTFLENFKFYFTEYCENTSIHGLKFLEERGRYIVEKLWWSICILTSISTCMILISQTYHKWENSPVIVTFATTETPIWKIPFPAITICPQIKSKRTLYNYTQQMKKAAKAPFVEETEANEFHYMTLICESILGLPYDLNVNTLEDKNILDFFLKVAPRFKDMVLKAKWLGEDFVKFDLDIENVFVPTLTSDGICYSFNMLDRDEIYTSDMNIYKNFGSINSHLSNWTLDTGYDNDIDLDTFPRRTMLAGTKGGLDLILVTEKADIDPICGESLSGYKVIVQHPTELPTADDQYFRVPLEQYVVAAVKPNMMTTSTDLTNYDPEDRHCYFINEKKLRFFKIYNQGNCLVECLANFTYDYCDCVGFYMPRDNSSSICGHTMTWCLNDANVIFLSNEVILKMKNLRQTQRKKKRTDQSFSIKNCNCLPSCNSLEFDMETSQSEWNWRALFSVSNMSDDWKGYHFSRLQVFYKDMQFLTSERNQLYGYTDFWANCGGLLGLFTGFSFISLAEIMYFLTLRFICNVKKFGLHYWSGAKELMETT